MNRVIRQLASVTVTTIAASTLIHLGSGPAGAQVGFAPAGGNQPPVTIVIGPEPVPVSTVGSPTEAAAVAERRAAQVLDTLNRIKARAAEEIAKRQSRLNELSTRLAQAKADCGVNGTLASQISGAQGGLNQLGVTIAGETDVTRARDAYRRIFGDYRVYILVQPKVNIAITCGNQVARVNSAREAATRIGNAIAAAKAKGKDTSAAEAALAPVAGLLASAEQQARSIPQTVVNLAPDRFDINVLQQNETALNNARAQEAAVNAVISQARSQLRIAQVALANARLVPTPQPAGQAANQAASVKAAVTFTQG